jgi:hypothetical protein
MLVCKETTAETGVHHPAGHPIDAEHNSKLFLKSMQFLQSAGHRTVRRIAAARTLIDEAVVEHAAECDRG